MDELLIKMLEDYPSMSNEEVEQKLIMRMNPNPDRADPWNRDIFTPEERQEIINYYQRIVLWDEIPKEDSDELTQRMVEFA
ncbi:hypothetical protein [Methanospirillum sp.]